MPAPLGRLPKQEDAAISGTARLCSMPEQELYKIEPHLVMIRGSYQFHKLQNIRIHMALVKFVSDKDCQVFIDMELVGKVTPQSMLKVSLEIGGYLIQIKDEDGNLIKEYELEIKPSDNQLLQKIDGSNNLDDIIEKLKNDSSLVFHCNRASFCHNGLYGFVDKKFNVVIPPIYYSVNEFVDNKAFVVRDFPEGRKTTMIDSIGNMFFNRWFDYIGESDDTILMGIDNRIIVYSKTKYDNIAEYYNAGYDYKANYIPVYREDYTVRLYGYINFDGDVVIPLVFNWVGNFNEQGKSEVDLFGRRFVIDKRGFVCGIDKQRNYLYTGWGNTPESVRDDFFYYNNFYDWFGEYEPFGPIKWKYIPIWQGNKWNIRASIALIGTADNKEKAFVIECDYILAMGPGFCVCKIGEIVKVIIADIIEEGFFEFSFVADNVRPIFKTDKAVNGDDPIFPESFQVLYDNKIETIDMNTILTNSKRYGYNRYS